MLGSYFMGLNYCIVVSIDGRGERPFAPTGGIGGELSALQLCTAMFFGDCNGYAVGGKFNTEQKSMLD